MQSSTEGEGGQRERISVWERVGDQEGLIQPSSTGLHMTSPRFCKSWPAIFSLIVVPEVII